MKKIPQLGIGTRQLEWDECAYVVQSGLEMWYTHIDTAERYWNELFVGQGIRASGVERDSFRLTTKIWIDNYEGLVDAFHESLERLQVAYVDLLLLHRPTTLVQHEKCFDELKQLQVQGKIKHFGISNFTVAQMQHAWEYTKGAIFTNQIEYHATLSQEQVKWFCENRNMVVTAYSPLGHGNLLKNQVLLEIAEKHGVSVAQVCIAWLLQEGVVVIPKARTVDKLKDNFEAQHLILDVEDLKNIALLPKDHRYIDPPFAPEWD